MGKKSQRNVTLGGPGKGGCGPVGKAGMADGGDGSGGRVGSGTGRKGRGERKGERKGGGAQGKKGATGETATGETGAIVPAGYNPRAISGEGLAGLRASVRIFGDLSGFVVNATTGNIVCGHQRRTALGDVDLAAVKYRKPFEVELGRPGERVRGAEQEGTVEMPGPDGEPGPRFRVRRVAWPLAFEKAANLAANNPAIQGTFTADAAALIAEVQATMPELVDEVRLDDLLAELRPTLDLDAVEPEIPEMFQVVVELASETAQRELYERLNGEGFECKVRTM